ncbi:hypothetical protein L2E82_44790 [Cichorium intybus]|uniref:Uncharacterized protein n=1 Tax=Cichorium intybus TaxID=13427 RepID=A0ACB8ZQB8_CICIN|nr:hypothetical protein L2E82_44790 [Cichorium intybus]
MVKSKHIIKMESSSNASFGYVRLTIGSHMDKIALYSEEKARNLCTTEMDLNMLRVLLNLDVKQGKEQIENLPNEGQSDDVNAYLKYYEEATDNDVHLQSSICEVLALVDNKTRDYQKLVKVIHSNFCTESRRSQNDNGCSKKLDFDIMVNDENEFGESNDMRLSSTHAVVTRDLTPSQCP